MRSCKSRYKLWWHPSSAVWEYTMIDVNKEITANTFLDPKFRESRPLHTRCLAVSELAASLTAWQLIL